MTDEIDNEERIMSKTTTLTIGARRLRRFAIALGATLTSLVAAVAAAPAAFAMRLIDPQGVTTSTGTLGNVPPTVTHSPGLQDWQIALIVVGAVFVAAVVRTASVYIRSKGSLRHAAI